MHQILYLLFSGMDDRISCIFLVRWSITCQRETFEGQHIDEMGSNLAPSAPPGHPRPLLHPSHYIEQSRLFMLQIYRYTNTEKNKYKKWKYTLRKYTHPTCLLSGNPPGSVALHMGPHPSHYRASQSAKEGPQHVFQPTTLDFDDGPQRQRPTTCIPTTQTLMLCYVWVPCK